MNLELDRALGCLVGLAVGDALGAPLEFSRRDSLPPVTDFRAGGPFNLKAGDWTDDTSCALALAHALLTLGGHFDAGRFLHELCRWREDGAHSHNGRCFDIGNATRQALIDYNLDGRLQNGNEQTQGNGALMRLAPVALVARSEIEAAGLGAAQCRTTHASSYAVADAMALAHLLWNEIDGCPTTFVGLESYPRAKVVSSGHSGATLHAAKWAVANTDNFRDAVLLAANLGDDSDTVAAVTGQIAGARYGFSNIPREWRDGIPWAKKILGTAGSLYALRGRD